MRRSHCNRLPSRASRLPPQPSIPGYIKSSLVAPRAALGPIETIEQMASDMREAAYREGGLTREGLELLGYSSTQIDTHAGAARQLANKQAVMS
jgi:hypothetical protein